MAQVQPPGVYTNSHPPLALPPAFPAGTVMKGRNINPGDPLSQGDVLDAKDDYAKVSKNSYTGYQAIQNSLAAIQATQTAMQATLTAMQSKLDSIDLRTRVLGYHRDNDETRAFNARARSPTDAFSPLRLSEVGTLPPLPLQAARFSVGDRQQLNALHNTVLQGIPPQDPTAARLGLRPGYIGGAGIDDIFPRHDDDLNSMTKLDVYKFVTWYNTNCGIAPGDTRPKMIQKLRRFIAA